MFGKTLKMYLYTFLNGVYIHIKSFFKFHKNQWQIEILLTNFWANVIGRDFNNTSVIKKLIEITDH